MLCDIQFVHTRSISAGHDSHIPGGPKISRKYAKRSRYPAGMRQRMQVNQVIAYSGKYQHKGKANIAEKGKIRRRTGLRTKNSMQLDATRPSLYWGSCCLVSPIIIIATYPMETKPSLYKRRTAHSLNSKTTRSVRMPESEPSLQKFEKGFHPFAEITSPSMYSTMNDLGSSKTNESQQLSKSGISAMLIQNKTRLDEIHKNVSRKRQQSYENYINSNVRYCKLLQLNNNKSKVLTSLKSNVGEIVIKLIQQHRPEDYQYVAEFAKISISGWKPQSREGQVCVRYKDVLYLLGGHNSNPVTDICSYSFKQRAWSKISENELRRSYHTGVVYKEHYFLIFGGMGKYNSYYKTRQCLNTLCLLSPLLNGVKQIKIQNEQIVEPRRSHSACIVGKQMLVFGGVNMYRQYLKDLKYLDLRELKWVDLQYKVETPQLEEFLQQGIANHVMIANFKQRQGYSKLYCKDYEPEQGVFVFGGANQLANRSVLIYIDLKRRTPKLHKLYPSGYLPSGIQPVVERVTQNLIAVISGEASERQMKLYKIRQNQFINVHYHSPEFGGVGSSMIKYQDHMYILFGVGSQGYTGAISSFKLEQKLKTQLQKQIRRKRRRSTVNKDLKVNFFSGEAS